MSEPVYPGRSAAPESAALTRALIIGGVRYENSAAKFWPSFVDEVLRRHPAADRLVLTAPCDGPLDPDLLTPESGVARALAAFDENLDFTTAMQRLAAEIEAAGPPPDVVLSVYRAGTELERRPLTDYLDAEVFPFLLVWLLEWSCLSEAAWNRNRVRGGFAADDLDRGRRYQVTFFLENRYMSEGLIERTVTVQWRSRDRVGEESGEP